MNTQQEKLDLILTLDYEVYGDGTGDVFEVMIHPTNRYLEFCKKHAIRSTIFFEVMEFIKMEEAWNSGNSMGYSTNPASAIRDQIINAYQLGHDIQLHIHPHWVNAIYKEGRWCPDPKYWKLTNVPLEGNSEFPLGLKELLKNGKDVIEGILKPINSNYRCDVFRAGGYCITPSQEIFDCLKDLGFKADSSVIPGATIDNEFYTYDFSNVKRGVPYWKVEHEVTDQSYKGDHYILEFPIFSKKLKRILKYDLQRVQIALKNKQSNINKIKDKVEGEKSFLTKVSYFLDDEFLTWDFCLFSLGKLNSFLKTAKAEKLKSGYRQFYPVVLIGHSKEFVLTDRLDKFVSKNRDGLNFLSIKDAVKIIENESAVRMT